MTDDAVGHDAVSRARQVLAALPETMTGVEELYRDLHAHPELSGQESATAARFARSAALAGFEVTEQVGGHGVVGVLANGPGPVIGLRADMDALPIGERTGLPYASQVTAVRDGLPVQVMHACGHDLHTACLAGAATLLGNGRQHWSGTLLLIGQPAEESMQGAKAMLADGLLRDFPQPDLVLAQHCAPTRAGMVHHRAGPVYTACRNFRITLPGKGAHGDSLRARLAHVPGQHTPFYAPDPVPSLRRGTEALVGAALAFLPGRES